MNRRDLELFRLEDRVLFEAAAVAEIVDAAEAAQDNPNANVNEAEKQAQDERDALKNVPPENPADQAEQSEGDAQRDPAEAADVDAQVEQLIQGEIPVTDGDVDVTIPELGDSSSAVLEAGESGNLVDVLIVPSDTTISSGKELVVINDTVPDRDAILAELKLNQEVLILEDGTGLAELNKYLDAHEGKYDAIHLVTHGNEGYIFVNSEKIDADNFDSAEWKAVGEHLTDDGDILLYGCNTAETDDGRLLVDKIAEASGADVAASVDITGIGGDWELEYASGTVETSEISVAGFDYRLTDHNVTSNTDSGDNTLRWALEEAQDGDSISFTLGSNNTIMLNSTLVIEINRFKLQGVTIDGGNTNGDNVILDGGNTVTPPMDGSLTYEANGVQIMAISGYNIVTLQNLTFQNGAEEHTGGGAIYCSSSTLTVSNSIFVGNSSYSGGAIYCINSDLTVINSIFERNSSVTASGAICAIHGVSTVRNSTFVENSAYGSGGAIFLGCDGSGGDLNAMVADSTFIENSSITGSGGAIVFYHYWPLNYTNLTIENSKFEGNSAGGQGGALSITDCSLLSIKESTFKNNSAGGNGGAIYLEYIHKSPDNRIIENSTFSENSADNAGGAIYDFNTDYAFTPLVVNGGIFSKNSALHGMGGAIASVREEGNGSSSRYWDIIVNGAVLKENTASRAGAIWADSRIIINNCSIINNSAKTVGAIELTTSKLWDTAPIIANTTFAENRETEENSGCVFLSAHTGYVAKLDIINCIILGAQENAYDIALSDKAKLIGCSVQVYNSLTGNVSPSVALKDGNKTGVRYQDVFKINADGSLIMNSDGSIPIKNKGLAAGNGVYVWHADSYTRIAYSKSPTGIDKTLIRGNFETDNKIDIDQHGKKREYVTDIGSLIRDEVFSVDITVNNDLYTYNGKSQGSSGYTWVAPIPEFTIDDTEAVYTYTDAEDVVSTEAPVNTGEYSVTVSGLKLLYEGQEVSADKYIFNYIPGTVTITPKEITIDPNDPSFQYAIDSKVYDGNTTVTGAELSIVIGGETVALNWTDGQFNSKDVVSVTDATFSGLSCGNDNYILSTDTVTVGAAGKITAKDITVTADTRTKVYGSADPKLTYQVDGLIGNDSLSGELTRATGEDVGDYAILQGTLANSNYNINFTGAVLSIIAKEIVIDPTDPNFQYTIDTKVYDGTRNMTGASITVEIGEETVALTWTGALFDSANVLDVTNATFTGLKSSNGNYILSTDTVTVSAAGKIIAKDITVTADAQTKVYGSADPELTYQVDGLVGDDTLAGSLEREVGEDVGEYAITQGTLSNSNYNISFTGAVLTITAKEITIDPNDPTFHYAIDSKVYDGNTAVTGAELSVVIGGETIKLNWTDGQFNSKDVVSVTNATFSGLTSTNSNYVLSTDRVTVDATGKITAKDITVTADVQTKVYGEADPELTYQVGGLVGDDTLSGALEREVGEDVGEYAILQGTLANSNYNINFTGATFTITAKEITIDPDDPTFHYVIDSKVYDGTTQVTGAELSVVIGGETIKLNWTDGQFNSKDVVSVTDATFTGLTSANSNYVLAADRVTVDASGKITAKDITVIGDAQTKVYGEADPELTYQVSGLVGEDTLTGSLEREVGEDVGEYAITQGTLANSNYNINFTGATFTITAKEITIDPDDPNFHYAIDSKVYDGNTTVTGAELSVVIGGETVKLNWTDGQFNSKDVVSVTNATFSGLTSTNSNYVLSTGRVTVDASGKILAKDITVAANDQTKIYGEVDPQLTYQVSGLVGNDTLAGSLTRAVGEDVGAYEITQGTLANSNYNISFIGATFTITAKEITIDPNDPNFHYAIDSKVYDGNTTVAGAELSVVIGGETVVLNWTNGQFNSKDVLSVTDATFTGLTSSNGNYVLSTDSVTVDATGKILAKDITVTADAQTKVYGSADPELTYQVSGLVGNDTLAGSLTRAVGEDVGAYEITQGTLANSNYNISFIGANLTITAKSDVVVKPSGLNFDQYSEAVNPNFSALHPALTGRGLASVGLFSRLNENVYAMNHSALHAHLELRNGLRGSINNETASGRAVLPIDHSMMTIDAPLKNHSGFLFSRTMVMKPEALANGKEIMIDSSFAELRHMENTSAEKTHSSWHFLPESVKLPRSFFIDDVPAEELPDPAYDLRGIRAELPRRADAFKSELELLLEELVGA